MTKDPLKIITRQMAVYDARDLKPRAVVISIDDLKSIADIYGRHLAPGYSPNDRLLGLRVIREDDAGPPIVLAYDRDVRDLSIATIEEAMDCLEDAVSKHINAGPRQKERP